MSISDATLDHLSAILASAERDPHLNRIIAARDGVLARFSPVFDRAAIVRLQREQYEAFLSFQNNHHWTGLGRKKYLTLGNMDVLRSGLATLLDENVPIVRRMDDLVNTIPGVGKAILTSILLVAYPGIYGVWNGTTEKALQALRIWPTFRRGMSLGAKYKAVNDLLLSLKSVLGIDLWTLDALFWRVPKLSKMGSLACSFFPDELPEDESFPEGARRQVTVNAYERNWGNRTRCIEHWGCRCYVCGFDFAEFYGDPGQGIIHVHHLVPLADMGGNYLLDPVQDLRPVCPNCHAVLHQHQSKPVMPIDEL